MVFSTMSKKMDIMHLYNFAGALHNPKAILLKAKVPYGQVKLNLLILGSDCNVIVAWLTF